MLGGKFSAGEIRVELVITQDSLYSILPTSHLFLEITIGCLFYIPLKLVLLKVCEFGDFVGLIHFF